MDDAELGDRTMRLTGELDLEREAELHAAGSRLLNDAGCSRLMMDLSGVTFIDSTALGAFVDLLQQAEASGREMVLCAPSQAVSRILDVTGLGEVFTVPAIDAA